MSWHVSLKGAKFVQVFLSKRLVVASVFHFVTGSRRLSLVRCFVVILVLFSWQQEQHIPNQATNQKSYRKLCPQAKTQYIC